MEGLGKFGVAGCAAGFEEFFEHKMGAFGGDDAVFGAVEDPDGLVFEDFDAFFQR